MHDAKVQLANSLKPAANINVLFRREIWNLHDYSISRNRLDNWIGGANFVQAFEQHLGCLVACLLRDENLFTRARILGWLDLNLKGDRAFDLSIVSLRVCNNLLV